MKRLKRTIAFLVMLAMVGTSVLTYAPMTVKAAGSELTEELTTYETGEGTTLYFTPDSTGYYGIESSQSGYVRALSFYWSDTNGEDGFFMDPGDGVESLFYLDCGKTYEFEFYSDESETMELAVKYLELVSAEASFVNSDSAVFEWNQFVQLGQMKVEMDFGEDGSYTLQSANEWTSFVFKACEITAEFEKGATESPSDRGLAGDNAILLDCHMDNPVRVPVTVKSIADNVTEEIQLDVPVSLTEEYGSGYYLLNVESGLYKFQRESGDCSMDLYDSSNRKLELYSEEGAPEVFLEAGQYVLHLDCGYGSDQVTVSTYDFDSIKITRCPDSLIKGYEINEDFWILSEVSFEVLNSVGETVKYFGEEGFGGAGIYIDGNKYNGNENNDLFTAGIHTLTIDYHGLTDSAEFTVVSLEEYAKTKPELVLGTKQGILFDDNLIPSWENESCFREQFYFTAPEDGNYGIELVVDQFEEYSYEINIYNEEGIYDHISSGNVTRTKTLTAGETYLFIVCPEIAMYKESVNCDITISKAPDVNNFSVYSQPYRNIYVDRADYLEVEQILNGMVIAVVYSDDSHVKVPYSGDEASEYAKLGIESVIVDEEGKEVDEEEGYAVGNTYTVQLSQSEWDFYYEFEFQYVKWGAALQQNAIEKLDFADDKKEEHEIYFNWSGDRKAYLLQLSEKTFFIMNTEINNPTEKGSYDVIIKFAEPNPETEWDGYQAGGEDWLHFNEDWEDSIGLQAGTYFVIVSNHGGDLGGEPVKFNMEKLVLDNLEVVSKPVNNIVFPSCGAEMEGLKVKLTYDDGSTEEVEYGSERWELLDLQTELVNEDSWYYEDLTEEEKEQVVYRICSYSMTDGETLGKLYFEEKGFEENLDVVDFEINTYKEFSFEEGRNWKVFKFTPEKDGEYHIYTAKSGVYDSCLYKGNTLIPVNEEQEWDTEWDKNYDYKRREMLEAGQTYYFVASHPYGGDVWLAITDSETNFHYVDWYHEQDPTCVNEGIAAGECICCWEYHTKPIEPIGHDYANEYTVDVEATAEADGLESRHCKRSDLEGNPCPATTDARIIPKTGTVYSDVNTMVKEKDAGNLTDDEKTEVKDKVSELTKEAGEAAVVNDNLNMSDVVALEELYVASEAAVTKTTVTVDEGTEVSATAEGAALTVQSYIPDDNDVSTTYNANLTIKKDGSTADTTLVLDINMAIVDSNGNVVENAEDIQPVAPIKITMPVPEGMEPGFELYHTDKDGNKEKIDYTIVEIKGKQYVEFIATSFSLYSFELDCQHIWQGVVGEFKNPTCQTDGYIVEECIADGCNKVKTQVLAKTEDIHTLEYYNSKIETCTEDGYDVYKCLYCDKKEIRNERGPLTHNYMNVVDKEATCTEEGALHKVCEYCGDDLNGQQFAIEKIPHVVAIDKAVELTCTTDGKTEGSHCAVCKEVFVAQEVTKSEGHNYVDGVCSKCGEEENSDTPPVDPDDPDDPDTPPVDPDDPEDPEDPVTGECIWQEKVSLTEGELLLILGGKEAGEFTFAKNGNGWTIQTEDDLYVAVKDGKLIYTEEAFVWTYQNARFSYKETSSGSSSGNSWFDKFFGGNWGSSNNNWFGGGIGNWWGSGSKETTYYLVLANGAVSVSTSNANASAEFYVEKSNDAHTWGTAVFDGEGKHVIKCTVCNYEKYEECTNEECELCNPAEPEASVNVSVKITSKSSGFGGWFGNIIGSKKTYTATITVKAEGTEVESVFYSTDNGATWKKGTSFTSNKKITEFDIRVEAANGMTYDFTYANGVVTE